MYTTNVPHLYQIYHSTQYKYNVHLTCHISIIFNHSNVCLYIIFSGLYTFNLVYLHPIEWSIAVFLKLYTLSHLGFFSRCKHSVDVHTVHNITVAYNNDIIMNHPWELNWLRYWIVTLVMRSDFAPLVYYFLCNKQYCHYS